ncbi:glycosyltransferase BC10-like [Mercurialis annua]|uniref:glycosyltransferase BC10-like n=1 Tax=Mercurialis annua TaxID=3986 RepID=UPI00216004D6|nr:glycosyltransferase BC10-like [Mercurialis annua]
MANNINDEKQPFQSTNSKPAKPYTSPLNNVFHFLLFIIGLSLGMLSCSYFKSLLSPIFTSQISLYSSFFSSPPSPLPPPSEPAGTNMTSSTNFTNAFDSFKRRESLMHNISDEELFSRAARVPNPTEVKIVPKLAFMFLTYGSIPFAPLWEKYFKGHEDLFSIYVHPHPSYNDSWPETSVFYGRRIPSQIVTWGEISMVDGERRLLANALLDISNQRFILLSESCIPIVNFKTAYNYLINSNLSYVESYDNPDKGARGRYNPKMSPTLNVTHWRKGSQWFELHRNLAVHIVSDQKYYQLFRDYCRAHACYSDEHYIPTFLNVLYPNTSANRTVTYVLWPKKSAHPRKFGLSDISEEFLNWIRYGSKCNYNGNVTSVCFLFGRKFAPDALDPLLRISPFLLDFDP